MEGLGSRLGRSSSRYGQPATAVFNGPVRKWKKKWVHVAQSQPSAVRNDHSALSTNGRQNTLLLRRWTPTTVTGDETGVPSEERPRRKFRYTPIVEVEDRRKVTERMKSDKVNGSDQSEAEEKPSNIDLNDGIDLEKLTMRRETSESDLGFDLKASEDDENDNESERGEPN